MVGGTGLIGAQVADALRQAGHEVVVIARSQGIDVTTGDGLDRALAAVTTVIDLLNTTESNPALAREFFDTATTGC